MKTLAYLLPVCDTSVQRLLPYPANICHPHPMGNIVLQSPFLSLVVKDKPDTYNIIRCERSKHCNHKRDQRRLEISIFSPAPMCTFLRVGVCCLTFESIDTLISRWSSVKQWNVISNVICLFIVDQPEKNVMLGGAVFATQLRPRVWRDLAICLSRFVAIN